MQTLNDVFNYFDLESNILKLNIFKKYPEIYKIYTILSIQSKKLYIEIYIILFII